MHQKVLPNKNTKTTLRIIPKKILAAPVSLLDPLTSLFIRLKISPNSITVAGLLAGLAAGFLFMFEHLFLGGILIIVCGIFDIIDGKVAVRTQKTTLYGAIFDSTLDRYSEFFIFMGIAFHFKDHWALWIIFWTILGSTMVSYTRARAEGLGVECKIGFMQRAERIVLLSLGSIVGAILNIFDQIMIVIMIAIALVSNITAIQRILLVKKYEKQKEIK